MALSNKTDFMCFRVSSFLGVYAVTNFAEDSTFIGVSGYQCWVSNCAPNKQEHGDRYTAGITSSLLVYTIFIIQPPFGAIFRTKIKSGRSGGVYSGA